MPKSKHRDLTREQRQRIGEAIRSGRGVVTQAELGDRIGEAQTTVSRWEGGEVDLDLSQAHRIEVALDLPAGWIGRTAGFVDVVALESHDPMNALRVGYFESFEDAAEDITAAATLGLGVRVSNRLVPWSEGEGLVEEWVVVLLAEPDDAR